MANSLSNFNTTFLGWDVNAIAEEARSIQQLKAQVVPFDIFTTTLKGVPQGVTTVTIPVATYPTGSILNSGGTSGVTVLNASTTGITVTCNQDAHCFFAFNPIEAQNNGLTNLLDVYLYPAIYGIDRQIGSSSFAIALNTSNFNTSSNAKPSTAASFSASMVTSLVGELGTNNIYGDRYIMVEPTRFWALMGSLGSTGNQAGANAILSGTPNNPFGVTVKESGILPTSVGNIVGFAGVKSALVVATSIPQVQHANGEQFVYISPQSGLPYLVEHYYDEFRRQNIIGASVLFGTAKGLGSLLQIVTS